MSGVATRYPAIDAAMGDCSTSKTASTNAPRAKTSGGHAPESDALLGLSLLVTQASKGMPLRVDIDGAARGHWQAGATLYAQRQGQMNLSCAQCHDQNFGQRLCTDTLS
jgi:sulfur-oxidizing protein SoxA